MTSKSAGYPAIATNAGHCPLTMRFGSTAKVLLKCKLKYYRISECLWALKVDVSTVGGHSESGAVYRAPLTSNFHRQWHVASARQQADTIRADSIVNVQRWHCTAMRQTASADRVRFRSDGSDTINRP